MVRFDVDDFEKSGVAMRVSTEVAELAKSFGICVEATKVYLTSATAGRNSPAARLIQSRTRRVENGWSEQERADRLRIGIARLTWLSTVVDQTYTQ